jgi:hypothetical protein
MARLKYVAALPIEQIYKLTFLRAAHFLQIHHGNVQKRLPGKLSHIPIGILS